MWSGWIELVDGYNSETGQGGTWGIPFHYTDGIGTRRMGNENFRSVSYNYYVNGTGPVHADISFSSLAWPFTVPRYQANVRRQFRSPSATTISSLTQNALELRQFPGFMMPGDIYVESFRFQCLDSDPGQDIYRPGSIAMQHANSTYYPYEPSNRDSCFTSNNPRQESSWTSQYLCNTNNLPGYAGSTPCPSRVCNVGRTACERPENVRITCEENVVNLTNINGTARNGNFTVERAFVGETLRHEWLYQNSCASNSAQLTYSCLANGTVSSQSTPCPAGTTCNYDTGQCSALGPSHDRLEISEYYLSANLPGGQGNGNLLTIHTIRFCSERSDAFRFGSNNTSCIYLLAKNRTAASRNLTGSWFYQENSSGNNSGDWINATDVFQTDESITRNITAVSPSYYYASGAVDTNVRFNVTFIGGGSWISGSGWTYNGAHTALEIRVPEIVPDPAYWRVIYDYGSAGATDGHFINASANNLYILFYGRNQSWDGIRLPYTSPRGSHVDDGGLNSNRLLIRYATQIHSN
ncbi:hypothetical protein HY571_00650 [Candidatus Micrarchaeota archaeon]|nr:hypothetical protein [Candidatus Micrarchaeota archaeon]